MICNLKYIDKVLA